MKTESFNIRFRNHVKEINVLTEDNIIHPNVEAYSSNIEAMEDKKENYRVIQKLLSDLVDGKILIYSGVEANKHVFKYLEPVEPNMIITYPRNYIEHRISVGPETQMESIISNDGAISWIAVPPNYENARTLENMLYTICQAHNIKAPEVIIPKSTFMTMFNRFMYPTTTNDKICSGIVTTLTLGAGAIYGGVTLANKLRS